MARQNTAGTVGVEIVVDNNQFEKGMTRSQKIVSRFSTTIEKKLIPSVKNLSRLFVFDLSGAVGGVVREFGQFIDESLKLARANETMAVSFEVMLGSAMKARDVIADIRKLAAETPLTSAELLPAAKLLIGADVAAEDLAITLRRVGDVAAGVGANVKEVAFVLQQVRTQGKALTQDINQFAARGIPIWKELQNVLGVNGEEVRKFVEQGKVGFRQVEEVFKNLTKEGGKFNNMLERLGDTAEGAANKAREAFEEAQRGFGRAMLPTQTAAFQAAPAIGRAQLAPLELLGRMAIGTREALDPRFRREAGDRRAMLQLEGDRQRDRQEQQKQREEASKFRDMLRTAGLQAEKAGRAMLNFGQNVGANFMAIQRGRQLDRQDEIRRIREAQQNALRDFGASIQMQRMVGGAGFRIGQGMGNLSNLLGAGIAPIANALMAPQQRAPGRMNEGVLAGSAQDIRLNNLRENQALFGEVADQGVQEQKRTNVLLEAILNAFGGGQAAGEVGIN